MLTAQEQALRTNSSSASEDVWDITVQILLWLHWNSMHRRPDITVVHKGQEPILIGSWQRHIGVDNYWRSWVISWYIIWRNEKVKIVNEDVKQKRPQKGTLRYTNCNVSITRTFPRTHPMNFNSLFTTRQVGGHQLQANEQKPYSISLGSSRLWSIESNALPRSIATATTASLLSRNPLSPQTF